jgi:endonuclease III
MGTDVNRGCHRYGPAPMSPPNRARVRRIRDRLRLVYGRPFAPPHEQGLNELILTVLSQSTNDRNRDVAYLALRRDFEDWTAVRDAPNPAVELSIRPGGISKVKSARIQDILRAIDIDTFDEDLARMSVDAGRDWLVSLPGVGRKTAACVLLFAYGKRDIPVDTHVSRVGTRLGLFREKAPFEELHDAMLEFTPRGQEIEFHVNLLRHGRRTCHSRAPKCGECALLRLCPTGYNLRQAD